jgi:branched-chain amino acid transport system substrate-binding protein
MGNRVKSQGPLAVSIFCLALCTLIGTPLFALEYTYDENAGFLYSETLDLYRQDKFEQAADRFAELVNDYPWDARITIFKLLQGKSLFYSGNFEQSKDVFQRLIKAHPKSTYISASHYFLGKIYYFQESYDSSVQSFMKAANNSREREHTKIYTENFISVARAHLEADELYSYMSEARGKEFAFEVGLASAEKYYGERRFERAEDIIAELEMRYPNFADDRRLGALSQKIVQFASQKAIIALFAPLSGDWARFGRMMSNAVDLAIAEYQEKSGIQVEKKIYDTFGDMIAAAIDAKRLTDNPVSAIIGPLSSAEAVGVAAFSEIGNIPVIAPTASEKGLTSVSDMFFQLTPTPERMGEALAEMVARDIGLDSVAVLAPLDNYGKQISDGFVHTAIDSGATVFYQTFYPRGTRDYRRFLLELKEELLPDTFVAEIFLNEEGDTMEVEEIPVHVPAIFMPSYESELKLLLPQLRFYKIKTILLGSDSYGESEIVEMRESKDNPVLFVSKTLTLPEDTLWLKFNYLYQTEYEEPPEEVAAATYDAANIVLNCVRKGLYTSDEIWKCVREKQEYEGASGKIRFSAQRENIYVPVYFLTEGEIIRLE